MPEIRMILLKQPSVLTIKSELWYSIRSNGLYFGGGLGDAYVDRPVKVTVTPVN